MKPMYAFHKDADGQVLSAKSWSYDFEFKEWLDKSDIRAGDSIVFGEAVKREPEPVPTPAFLTDEPPASPEASAAEAASADDMPF